MKIAILSVTKHGKGLSEKLSAALPEHETRMFTDKKLKETVASIFSKYDALVFVMATGIVVRLIAGHIKDKKTDPAVVVLDEKGNHAISLLSGHLGGANELAALIGDRIGAAPVITTATDVHNKPSVEGIAKELGLTIEDFEGAKSVNSAIVNDKRVAIASDVQLHMELPENVAIVDLHGLDQGDFDALVLVTNKRQDMEIPHVFLRPRNLIAGVGTKRDIGKEDILNAINRAFKRAGLSIGGLKTLATPDFKVKERGIVEASKELGVPLRGIDAKDIKRVENDFETSEYVCSKVGVGAVSEPCAVLGGRRARLLHKKIKSKGVTVAIAQEFRTSNRMVPKLFLVGIGPGKREHMSQRAIDAIERADAVVGYKTYLNLIGELTLGKEVISTGMRREVERAKLAVDEVLKGKCVAIVSSGDPGIYAMASVVFEYLKENDIDIDIEIVPGITAASAAAACLGSPLGHDFAVVSLSDLLTSWDVIERRLEGAAKADFVLVLYNPKSSGRKEQIRRAVRILKRYRDAATPVGIVKNAMRDGESAEITTLEKMLDCQIDMLTTIIVGNSETFVHNGKMVTPRGYKL